MSSQIYKRIILTKKAVDESGDFVKFFSLLLIIIIFFHNTYAQEHTITPSDPNLKIEDRILKLEKAVQELQHKTYGAPDLPPPSPTPTPPAGMRHYCEIKVFGRMYTSYGRTKLQAKDDLINQCKISNIEPHHCGRPECKELK